MIDRGEKRINFITSINRHYDIVDYGLMDTSFGRFGEAFEGFEGNIVAR